MTEGMVCSDSIVGLDVIRLLKERRHGQVMQVMNASLYLEFKPRQVIVICSDEHGYVPFGVSVGRQVLSQMKEQISGGMLVRACEQGFWFGNDGVRMFFDEQIPAVADAVEKREYQVCHQKWLQSRQILAQRPVNDGLSGMINCLELLRDWNEYSCHCEDKVFCRYAAPAIQGLLSGMRSAGRKADSCRMNPEQMEIMMEEHLNRLLGLGVGLTPSGDDFLTGFCYAVLRRKDILPAYKHCLTAAVLKLGPLRTSAISNAYLNAAARGRFYEVLEDLLEALSGNGSIESAMNRLLKVGNTSGKEMALGLLFGTSDMVG